MTLLKISATLLAISAIATAATAQERPAIIGISHMCVYASDMAASDNFYGHILGASKGKDLQYPSGTRYSFSATQFVEVLPLPADHPLSRQNCVAFTTSDATALHGYLQSHNVADLGDIQASSDGSHWFRVKDPEGNLVQFIQSGEPAALAASAKPIGTHIIHVGYFVHSKTAEDKFYRDLLGFRPYWYGAMKPDKVDWISLQVPDGHDWIEYMMGGEGTDFPAQPDARDLGGMNHFSIGVPNMEAAVTTLYREDRLSPRHNGPAMGADGKWQANFYDPDGTRVELMEFQPVMTPCCSAFTAESPAK